MWWSSVLIPLFPPPLVLTTSEMDGVWNVFTGFSWVSVLISYFGFLFVLNKSLGSRMEGSSTH